MRGAAFVCHVLLLRVLLRINISRDPAHVIFLDRNKTETNFTKCKYKSIVKMTINILWFIFSLHTD